MRRNRHKKGDWLVRCDESGIVDYASNMRRRWDGLWVRKKGYETRHPQEFVMARNDPKPVPVVRDDVPYPVPNNVVPGFIGQTTIPSGVDGPADHLFLGGIGAMKVGTSFIVR